MNTWNIVNWLRRHRRLYAAAAIILAVVVSLALSFTPVHTVSAAQQVPPKTWMYYVCSYTPQTNVPIFCSLGSNWRPEVEHWTLTGGTLSGYEAITYSGQMPYVTLRQVSSPVGRLVGTQITTAYIR